MKGSSAVADGLGFDLRDSDNLDGSQLTITLAPPSKHKEVAIAHMDAKGTDAMARFEVTTRLDRISKTRSSVERRWLD